MDSHRFIIISVFFTLLALSRAIDEGSHSCSDKSTWLADLKHVEVNDCQEGEECELVRGTDKGINITFIPKNNINKILVRVHGIVAGVAMPYTVPQVDGCQNSGITCPLKAGIEVTYTAVLPVLKFYPLIHVPVIWELLEDNAVIACTEIKAKIIKKHHHHEK